MHSLSNLVSAYLHAGVWNVHTIFASGRWESEEVGHYVSNLCIVWHFRSLITFMSLHFQLSSLVAWDLFGDQAGNSFCSSQWVDWKASFGNLYNLIVLAHDLVQPPPDENVNRLYMLHHQKQEAMIFDITVWKLPVCMISQHTMWIGMYVQSCYTDSVATSDLKDGNQTLP